MISTVCKSLNSSKKTLVNVASYTTATTATTTTNSNSKSIYNTLRRKRDRQGLVNVERFEESETTVFPRSRQGLDYQLNWALNGYSITPSNSAYRNPRLPLLLQNSNGITDKNNVLIHSVANEQASVNYYLDESIAKNNQSSNLISIVNYKAILESVKANISESSDIYVHDSAVGSDVSTESTIRVVTNDAVSSLFIKHLLPSTTPSEVKDFKHSLTLYCVPDFKINNFEKLGLKSSSFNVIDVKRGIAVISGINSTENIRNVISSISSHSLMNQHQDTVTLSADIYQSSSTTTAPILIFNNDGFLLNKKFESGKVISQGSIWSKQGLSRLYNSITYNFESIAQNQYDLIEKFVGSKKVNTTVPIKFETNSFKQPSSVVFIIKDNTGVIPAFSELSVEQAEKYFVSGYSGNDTFNPFFIKEQNTTQNSKKTEIFKNLIKDNGTNVYIINPLSFQKDAEVDKLLGSIISGQVGKSTKSDIYNTCSPIQTGNVASTKNAEEIKKLVKSFESKLNTTVEKLLL